MCWKRNWLEMLGMHSSSQGRRTAFDRLSDHTKPVRYHTAAEEMLGIAVGGYEGFRWH